MIPKTSYNFVLWGVPRFQRSGAFQKLTNNASDWIETGFVGIADHLSQEGADKANAETVEADIRLCA